MGASNAKADVLRRCIQHCLECHLVCVETMSHCLRRGGAHAAAAHIHLLATCADLCRLAAEAMLREVEAHDAICEACAEVCRQCGDSCEALADDEPINHCMETCRRCGESCAAIAAT